MHLKINEREELETNEKYEGMKREEKQKKE